MRRIRALGLYLAFLAFALSAFDLGWTGVPLIPVDTFLNASRWTPNAGNPALGDRCSLSADSGALKLQWRFGPGMRSKYCQAFLHLSPSGAIAVKPDAIFGIEVNGTRCSGRRNIRIKFENGKPAPSCVQANWDWPGLARITRWSGKLCVVRSQLNDQVGMNWDSVRILSIEVFSDTSQADTAADSGVVWFKPWQVASTEAWERATSLESINKTAASDGIASRALDALLSRQDTSTGLFFTWKWNNGLRDTTDTTSWEYGHGLLLQLLSLKGMWAPDGPVNRAAKAAERLAIFLVNNRIPSGHAKGFKPYWPRTWNTMTGKIVHPHDSDNQGPYIWMGDFPWIITGLHTYYKKCGDLRVRGVIDTAVAFLTSMVTDNGKLFTVNPVTDTKREVTSFEAYTAALWCLREVGQFENAAAMLNYIVANGWDSRFRYFREWINAPRVVLLTNAWLSPFLWNSGEQRTALDALSFIGKALYAEAAGEPAGLDGVCPLATWFEGTLAYIAAGGPGSKTLVDGISAYLLPDGSAPAYNDNLGAVGGIWAEKWSSLDATTWLCFVASGISPFQAMWDASVGEKSGRMPWQLHNTPGQSIRLNGDPREPRLFIDAPASMHSPLSIEVFNARGVKIGSRSFLPGDRGWISFAEIVKGRSIAGLVIIKASSIGFIAQKKLILME